MGASCRYETIQVNQLLATGLDAETAREYRIALERVPHLVARESCTLDYLGVEQYNVPQAAIRLAK